MNRVRELGPSRLVLILGGSFDPVHLGHLHLIKSAQKHVNADAIVLIPCGKPPHKDRSLVAPAHRVEMLKLSRDYLSQEHNFNSELIDIDLSEVDAAQPSYTLATLKLLNKKHQGENIHFLWLMGMDSFNSLNHWFEWQALFDYASFIVADRPGDKLKLEPEVMQMVKSRSVRPEQLKLSNKGCVCYISIDALEVSSTRVRDALKSRRDALQYLPANVLKYINEHQLYR